MAQQGSDSPSKDETQRTLHGGAYTQSPDSRYDGSESENGMESEASHDVDGFVLRGKKMKREPPGIKLIQSPSIPPEGAPMLLEALTDSELYVSIFRKRKRLVSTELLKMGNANPGIGDNPMISARHMVKPSPKPTPSERCRRNNPAGAKVGVAGARVRGMMPPPRTFPPQNNGDVVTPSFQRQHPRGQSPVRKGKKRDSNTLSAKQVPGKTPQGAVARDASPTGLFRPSPTEANAHRRDEDTPSFQAEESPGHRPKHAHRPAPFGRSREEERDGKELDRKPAAVEKFGNRVDHRPHDSRNFHHSRHQACYDTQQKPDPADTALPLTRFRQRQVSEESHRPRLKEGPTAPATSFHCDEEERHKQRRHRPSEPPLATGDEEHPTTAPRLVQLREADVQRLVQRTVQEYLENAAGAVASAGSSKEEYGLKDALNWVQRRNPEMARDMQAELFQARWNRDAFTLQGAIEPSTLAGGATQRVDEDDDESSVGQEPPAPGGETQRVDEDDDESSVGQEPPAPPASHIKRVVQVNQDTGSIFFAGQESESLADSVLSSLTDEVVGSPLARSASLAPLMGVTYNRGIDELHKSRPPGTATNDHTCNVEVENVHTDRDKDSSIEAPAFLPQDKSRQDGVLEGAASRTIQVTGEQNGAVESKQIDMPTEVQGERSESHQKESLKACAPPVIEDKDNPTENVRKATTLESASLSKDELEEAKRNKGSHALSESADRPTEVEADKMDASVVSSESRQLRDGAQKEPVIEALSRSKEDNMRAESASRSQDEESKEVTCSLPLCFHPELNGQGASTECAGGSVECRRKMGDGDGLSESKESHLLIEGETTVETASQSQQDQQSSENLSARQQESVTNAPTRSHLEKDAVVFRLEKVHDLRRNISQPLAAEGRSKEHAAVAASNPRKAADAAAACPTEESRSRARTARGVQGEIELSTDKVKQKRCDRAENVDMLDCLSIGDDMDTMSVELEDLPGLSGKQAAAAGIVEARTRYEDGVVASRLSGPNAGGVIERFQFETLPELSPKEPSATDASRDEDSVSLQSEALREFAKTIPLDDDYLAFIQQVGHEGNEKDDSFVLRGLGRLGARGRIDEDLPGSNLHQSPIDTVARSAHVIDTARPYDVCLQEQIISSKLVSGRSQEALEFCHDTLTSWYENANKELCHFVETKSAIDMGALWEGIARLWILYPQVVAKAFDAENAALASDLACSILDMARSCPLVGNHHLVILARLKLEFGEPVSSLRNIDCDTRSLFSTAVTEDRFDGDRLIQVLSSAIDICAHGIDSLPKDRSSCLTSQKVACNTGHGVDSSVAQGVQNSIASLADAVASLRSTFPSFSHAIVVNSQMIISKELNRLSRLKEAVVNIDRSLDGTGISRKIKDVFLIGEIGVEVTFERPEQEPSDANETPSGSRKRKMMGVTYGCRVCGFALFPDRQELQKHQNCCQGKIDAAKPLLGHGTSESFLPDCDDEPVPHRRRTDHTVSFDSTRSEDGNLVVYGCMFCPYLFFLTCQERDKHTVKHAAEKHGEKRRNARRQTQADSSAPKVSDAASPPRTEDSPAPDPDIETHLRTTSLSANFSQGSPEASEPAFSEPNLSLTKHKMPPKATGEEMELKKPASPALSTNPATESYRSESPKLSRKSIDCCQQNKEDDVDADGKRAFVQQDARWPIGEEIDCTGLGVSMQPILPSNDNCGLDGWLVDSKNQQQELDCEHFPLEQPNVMDETCMSDVYVGFGGDESELSNQAANPEEVENDDCEPKQNDNESTEEAEGTKDAVQCRESFPVKWNRLSALAAKWEVKWFAKLEELRSFQEQHSHCNVPPSWPENTALAKWVSKQRHAYKMRQRGKKTPLTPERIQVLEALGFEWVNTNQKKRGRKKETDQKIIKPPKHALMIRTNSPSSKGEFSFRSNESEAPPSSRRIVIQDSEKKQRGRQKGCTAVQREQVWKQRFEELRLYKKVHGNCNVPYTVNKTLAHWICLQRNYYKEEFYGRKKTPLTPEREAALKSLGFEWVSSGARRKRATAI